MISQNSAPKFPEFLVFSVARPADAPRPLGPFPQSSISRVERVTPFAVRLTGVPVVTMPQGSNAFSAWVPQYRFSSRLFAGLPSRWHPICSGPGSQTKAISTSR